MNNYADIKRIGRGNYGTVSLARDVRRTHDYDPACSHRRPIARSGGGVGAACECSRGAAWWRTWLARAASHRQAALLLTGVWHLWRLACCGESACGKAERGAVRHRAQAAGHSGRHTGAALAPRGRWPTLCLARGSSAKMPRQQWL
jgi:hypothetical protein